MKSKLLLCFILVFPLIVKAQCNESTKTEILLVGDSWAFFMNVDGTINNVAKDWGHSNVKYYTNLTLSENGAETDDFLKPAKVAELQNQLTSLTDLKAVHLSIGGNDFLGDWNKDFTQAEVDTLYEGVASRLDSIVDIIHQARPDVHVFWSGYVYTNFKEVIEGTIGPLQSSHPFYSRWQAMGFPNFQEINTVQNYFQSKIQSRYVSDSKFTYVPASAMMQYVFGQSSSLGSAPGGSYPALTVPLPYGKIDYPSPKNTMRDYGVTKDCFHLSKAGFAAFVSYHFQKFYHKLLMDDAYTVANFDNSGSVSKNGVIDSDIIVGKDASDEYAGIISLDNTHIADTSIDNLSLYLKINEISNTNFLSSGDIEVEIVNDKFGNSATLEAEDFSYPATASGNVCVFGNANEGKWVRLELPSSFLHIVKQSNAQIRIKYTGTADGLIHFSNVSSNDDFQAILNIKYGLTAATNTVDDISFDVYPNPAIDILNISSSQTIDYIAIYSIDGKLMTEKSNPSATVSIATLPKGLYFLNIQAGKSSKNLKFIKQ